MATITKRKTSIAIIGGGLSGLVTAAVLERAGLNYLLIDDQNEFGGLIKGQQEHGVWLDYGLKSVPLVGELTSNSLIQLKEQLNLNIQIESFNLPVLAHDKDGFKEFLGFGNIGGNSKLRPLIEELSYYTETPRLLVSGGWKNLVDELLKIIPDSKKRLRSHVTKLDFNNGKVTHLHINGDTLLSADYVIWTLSPNKLQEMLPTSALNTKVLQRIGKIEPYTVLSLDIATKDQVTDQKNIFLLSDTNDEPFYVLGQFINNVDPLRNSAGFHISTWMTLIDAETAQSEEETSKIYKSLKKVIKKAFPSVIENAQWERLLAVKDALSLYEQLPLEKNGTLSDISNLFMCGGQLKAKEKNCLSAIKSAQFVAQQLAIISKTTAPELRSDSTVTQ